MSTLPGTAATPTPLPSGSPLVVRTHAIPDPGALLALLPHTEPDELVSWVRHGEGLVGWGRAATFEVSGPDRFALADQWWRDVVAHAVVRDEVRQPGSGPVVFGSLPFADDSAEQGLMVVPEVVVGRRADRWWVTTIGHDSHLPPIPSLGPSAPGDAPADVRFTDGALTPDDWKRAVSKAVERISRGELDKVVLARDLRVQAAAPIDPTVAAAAAGRAVRPHLDVRGRRAGRGHSGAAGPPRPGTRPLPGARRHHPAQRRRRARPGPGGVTRAVQQGPRGARVCGSLGRRGARPALLLGERARDAVRAAPQQRHAPGDRRRGGRGRPRHVAGPRRVAAPDRGGRWDAGRRGGPAHRRARGHGPRPVRRAGGVDGRVRRRRVGDRAALRPVRRCRPERDAAVRRAAGSSPVPTRRPRRPRPRPSSSRCATP